MGAGISSQTTLLFYRPISALLPAIGRELIDINKDDEYYKALRSNQATHIKKNNTHMDSTFINCIYSSCPEGRMGSMNTWEIIVGTTMIIKGDATECRQWMLMK